MVTMPIETFPNCDSWEVPQLLLTATSSHLNQG